MSHTPQKEALRWRLRLIFLYYASYADRNNYKLLKSQNYRRFLIDSQSVTDQSGFPPFDIAFRKVHSSSIKLQQFQQMLPQIAQLVTRNKNRKEAFKLFISQHMEKLYLQILSHTQFGADVLSLQTLKIETDVLDFLNTNALQKAYHIYIESTSMHQKYPQQTFQQVHIFLSDFQVSPKLVYKAMVYLAFFYQLTVSTSNSWGLEDLSKLLVCIAELYWRRTDQGQTSQQTKVVLLLQHMETSVGFKKMADKALKQNAVLISFFKRPLRFATLLKQSRQRQLASSLDKNEHHPTKNLEGSRYFSAKRERQLDVGPIKGLLQQQGDMLTKVKEIFERLCSHGQVGNINTLKSMKIKKYFKGLNILATLEQTWVDITIADLCRSSPSGKIEFSQFLQLLQIVAQKLNIVWQGLFHYLIDHSEIEVSTSRAYFSSKPVNSQHPNQTESTDILFQVEKPLQKIFVHYREGKKRLTFDQLSHMLYEFQIFPAFVSKAKLYVYFQNRSKASSELKKLVGEISLDMRGFFDVLVDVAHQIGDTLTQEEKVLFLLQRMQDSPAHKKILGSQGTNLIGDLRSRYASIYKQNIVRQSPVKEQGFDYLLAGYQVT